MSQPDTRSAAKKGGWCEVHGGYTGDRCGGRQYDGRDCDAASVPRVGVWRRGPTDWAYRVEVEGYGSIAGVGFRSRDEARKAMHDARIDAWKRRELSNG